MIKKNAKVIYLTAGAGGMYCGSCMHDNALASALSKDGWDIQLVPTYTPIRTDETDFSADQVFFGGINVYLQQKIPLLRFVPRILDRFLDNPKLIRRVTSGSIDADARMLGELAVSMLRGSKGNQRKEVKRLCKWLVEQAPDLIVFSNILIGGCIPDIKKQLDIPVLVTLQGDDVFLDHLAETHKAKCIEQIRMIAESVDGFVVHSEFFKAYMSQYFGLPEERIHVTPLGIDLEGFGRFLNREYSEQAPVIGYMARLAPQKGLHILVDAFIQLKQNPNHANARLLIAGWLGKENQAFADAQFQALKDAGLDDDYEYLGAITRDEKLTMLGDIDLLCVPAEFLEPKGLYALEALAAGVPVVKPDHACFPELIEQSQGGVLFKARDANDLTRVFSEVLQDRESLFKMGKVGQQFVHQHRGSEKMAAATSALFQKMISDHSH